MHPLPILIAVAFFSASEQIGETIPMELAESQHLSTGNKFV